MQWFKRQQLLLYSIILIGTAEMGTIVRGALYLLGLLGSLDFVLSHSEHPGWVGKILRLFLEPPAGVQALLLLSGIYLLWLYERRRNAAIYEPKLIEDQRLTVRLTQAQDMIAKCIAFSESAGKQLDSLASLHEEMRAENEIRDGKTTRIGWSIERVAGYVFLRLHGAELRDLCNIIQRETYQPAMETVARELILLRLTTLAAAMETAYGLCQLGPLEAMPANFEPIQPAPEGAQQFWGVHWEQIRRAAHLQMALGAESEMLRIRLYSQLF
jgi:hypothetical protein